jgi:RNA 3'-terminal phosphate cyclase (GTP)
MITIDGSFLEGGGQILRTSLALSTILNKEVEIFNIRKKRKNPGLAEQHLRIIESYKKIFEAKCEGDYFGSQRIRFYPSQKIKEKYIRITPRTSSSIGLILQAILPPLYFLNKKIALEIEGGTSGKWAPPFDFYPYVIFPILNVKVEFEVKRRGYYPKGGGLVWLDFKDYSQKRIKLKERGKLEKIKIMSFASISLKRRKVAERQLEATSKYLREKIGKDIESQIEYFDTLSDGSEIEICVKFSEGIILWADALGEKGKPAEEVAKAAVEKLLNELEKNSCCDFHLADNLIPYLAFLGGELKTSQITNHTLTNIWVCEKFLGKNIFKIEGNSIKAQKVLV